jgi:hypothetical protein
VTILEHLQEIVPVGERCDGCPKGDPHNLPGYSGDVFCHLLEEVMMDGIKDCGINDPGVSISAASREETKTDMPEP